MSHGAVASDRATRWVFVLAGCAAVAGALMKLSDLLGPDDAPRVVSVSRDRPRPRDDRAAASSATRSLDVGSGIPSGSRFDDHPGAVGEDARARAEHRSTLDQAARPRTTPQERRERVQRLRAARRAARARRAGKTVADDPSLDVRSAGGDSDARLAATDRTPAGAVASSERPAKPAQEQAEPPAAPVSDVIFDSGDSGQYATNTPTVVDDLEHIAGTSGTLSFWLQPQWGDGSVDDASFLELGDGRLRVLKNVNFLRFEWTGDGGETGGLGVPIASWKDGEWHAVTTTWSGNSYALYVDGQLVSSKSGAGRVELTPDTTLTVGSNYPESRPIAPGTIARVDVRNRPLGPGEIANAYKTIIGK